MRLAPASGRPWANNVLTSNRRWRWSRSEIIAAALATIFLGSPSNGEPSRPQSTALWRVVHDLCVTDKRTLGLAAPCTAVDLRRGFALVKDAGGPTGYLLVPTRRLTGIEDPALLKDDAPNYWQMAWEARGFVQRKAPRKLDRTDIGIAVNSLPGRSQNQLHFHIDCVRQDVKKSLRAVRPTPDGSWAKLVLLGHPYRVMTIDGENPGTRDPFRLIFEHEQGTAKERSGQTLLVVGADLGGAPGFYVLWGSVGPKIIGHGEELLDHRCKPAR